MKSIILALVVFCSIPTFAQTGHSSDTSSEETFAQPAKSLSQSEKRAQNRFVLLAQPFGLEFPNTIDVIVGASAGYYVTPELITSFGIEYASSPEASDYGQHDSITTFGANAQYFLSGSFYAKGGLLERNINSYTYGDYTTTNADGSRYKSTTNLSEFAATVAIGNQWQIHHFVIGCDWITYDLPLFSSKSSSDSKINVDSTNIQFVKLHIGASF